MTIVQFVDRLDGTGLLTGAMKFGGSGVGAAVNPTPPLTTLATETKGYWVSQTFEWSVTPTTAQNLTLTITGDTSKGNGELFVDSLIWNVVGDLVAVPEFSSTQAVAACGLILFSAVAWKRRNATPALQVS